MTIFYKSIYNDGTSFIFSEDDAGKGDYAKIDRTKLTIEEVWQDAKLIHRLYLEQGQRLILRKRHLKKFNAAEFDELSKKGEIPLTGTIQIILIGYQETIKGQNKQAITAIFPDGHTELIGAWKVAPFDAVILTEAEKIEM